LFVDFSKVVAIKNNLDIRIDLFQDGEYVENHLVTKSMAKRIVKNET